MRATRAGRILSGVFVACAVPFAAVLAFPAQLHGVMHAGSYVVFHNTAEFFSIMVSLSVFGVGWFAFEQSKDRHALFLGTALLATGILDFMHTLANAAMPAFITPNSTNKSTQFWIAARLVASSSFLVSAFVTRGSAPRWITKPKLLAVAVATCATAFTAILFFPEHVPATFVPGVGLTRFKVGAEWLTIAFLVAATAAYWRRLRLTGDPLQVGYMAAFVVGIFSEAAFASYRTGFDTYNVLGHVYKVVGFFLVYRAAFVASIAKPYLELEDRVAERTARLEAANRALEENRAGLQEASRRKDEFLGMLSHELRNPLAPIRNAVHVLELAGAATERAERARTIIKRQTDHLARLVDDLLDVTRIARGKVDLRRTRVDLVEIVLRTAEDFRPLLEERGVALHTVVPGASVWCEADGTRIAQVLGNLLHNASKFSAAGQDVTVSLGVAEGEAELRVRDGGAGIDPALLPHVFDAFVQGDRSLARASGGLGLGLALVKAIAELHGGSVRAESDGPGKGAEFVVRVPIDVDGSADAGPEAALA